MLIIQISDHIDEEESVGRTGCYCLAQCVLTSLVITLLGKRGLTVMLIVLFSV